MLHLVLFRAKEVPLPGRKEALMVPGIANS